MSVIARLLSSAVCVPVSPVIDSLMIFYHAALSMLTFVTNVTVMVLVASGSGVL